MTTPRQRWFEKYTLNQRVEVRTFLHGVETWRPGVVTSLPKKASWGRPGNLVGDLVVLRDSTPTFCWGEVRVSRSSDVRPLGV